MEEEQMLHHLWKTSVHFLQAWVTSRVIIFLIYFKPNYLWFWFYAVCPQLWEINCRVCCRKISKVSVEKETPYMTHLNSLFLLLPGFFHWRYIYLFGLMFSIRRIVTRVCNNPRKSVKISQTTRRSLYNTLT